MPLKNIWYLLWAYYSYNDVKTVPFGDEDSMAIMAE